MYIHWKSIARDLGNVGLSVACGCGAIAAYSLYTHEKVQNPDVYIKIYLAYKLLNKSVSDFQNNHIYTGTEDQKMINVIRVISSFVITNAILGLVMITFDKESSMESLKNAFLNNTKGFMIFTGAIAIPQHLIYLVGSKIAGFVGSYFPKPNNEAPS